MGRIFHRIVLALGLTLAAAASVQAQDTAAEISQQVEDDKGFITRFLQEKLSGAGRQVVIDGFQGALSSRATFTRMTIADDDGVWITLENGALSWSRSALLSRRIQINELSAEKVILPRLPGGGDKAPAPEAREFALPQLPVAVNIDKIQVGRVELGQAILGQEAVLAIDGSMNLANGEGQTKLTIDRVDGPRGRFLLDAGFSNASRILALDLKLDEDANGLFVNLVRMNGRPALQAEIAGTGPLSDYSARIQLSTDGQPRVQGQAQVRAEAREGADGTAFRLRLDGDIAPLVAPQNQQFFAGTSLIRAEGWRGADGRLLVPELKVTTGALDLSGSVATTARGAPESAHLTLLLGRDAGATQLPVALPVGDKPLTVTSGNLRLDYDAAQGAGWVLQGRVGDVTRPDLMLSELRLDGRGRVVLTDDRALAEVRGWVAFGMDDVKPTDPGLAQALGDTLNGGLNFAFTPGNALRFWGMNINGNGYGFTGEMELAGLKSGLTLTGDIAARHDRLADFSTLAGRELGGRAEAQIKGRYALLGKGFDLDTRIKGVDISLGQDQADRMLAGESTIDLSARRDTTGIHVRQLTVNARNLTAEARGFLSSQASDLSAQIQMPDLSVADPRYGGAASTQARLTGPDGRRKLALSGKAQDLRLGRPEIDGAFKGETDLTVQLLETDGVYELQQFRLLNPQLDAAGRGTFTMQELDGELSLSMPDLSVLGRGLSGGVSLQGKATKQGAARRVELTGRGTDLRLGQQDVDGALTGITELALSAREQDGEFTVDSFRLQNQQMQATAQGSIGSRTDMTGAVDIRSLASFGRGWRGALTAQGSFRDDGTGGRRLEVTGSGRDLAFGQAQVDGALQGETRLSLQASERDGVFTVQTATVQNPRLALDAAGRLGQGATDLTANLRADDLRFLGRGFRGAVTAQARVQDQPGGTRAISASGNARGLAIGNAQADPLLAGQTSFDLQAQQRANGSLTVSRLRAENPQLRLSGDGDPATGLNLDARLTDLGLLLPSFPGPAELRGRIQNSGANYVLALEGSAPGDTRARINGSVATDFSRADVRIEGSSNAAAANPFLRTRSIEGPLSFDLRLDGPPGLQALSGQVALTGGRLAEPRLGLAIGSLNARADLGGGRIQVDISGAVEAGGTITVTGPIALTGDRPMDLSVRLSDVVLRDPNLYETRANGSIRVTGSQAAGPLVSGRIDLGTTELRIPSTGLGGAKAIPDIIHLSERPPQRQTRAKAGLLEYPSADSRAAGMAAPPATPPANPARFDLLISAPDQVFVRGRGVDAELGGEIRLTGNARQPIPIGQLELIRGRVDLLGKRLNLTEGLIELQGSLMPVIRLVAQIEQDGITTRIIIDGEARDPEITFESSPELPEEEVLSQLLFGRGLDNISALQAAQLASAVATLAGRGGDGIIGRLRASTGLDDLDLTTDNNGNVSLRAGKYLSEKVYTDVQVGGDGKTRLNLNLDVSKTVTVRGSVDSDGESSVGVFYERDY
ncbi:MULTISPECIES: translocation/assembly module TamB domain-containing protein [unclassified Paracoccus (in: a-proteobacteria)]|uniref:translocation/assembly module TamB domain-containing protein n=1 Tax=unclassified Paracoccus (in: a-proteobacteria) TaxID=2688777 RepID=UPI0012B3450A|nr:MULTISPECIES: translocation/assembly module TamB domain-containing protein [unclassified Paracoccus (in: a-proteobacteria)]UXU75858.1 translocation/assembly module TamB domain-containing protein [Paracoccus sp. SMMA_5]UXU81767.1 translocation/assembly module TamB domain-containing protein [Paracoccus sp. SMMA_5_TC]